MTLIKENRDVRVAYGQNLNILSDSTNSATQFQMEICL